MAIKWGRLLVGASAAYIAIDSLKAAFARADAAMDEIEVKRGGSPCPGDGSMPCKLYPAGSIESRAKKIAGLIRKGSLDPKVRRLAVRSVSKKCGGDFCTPSRNAMAELQQVLGDLKNPSSELARGMKELDGVLAEFKSRYRYVSDARLADQFQSAKRTLFDYHGGDCDDAVISLGALYMALGYPVKTRIYTLKGQSEPGHIALLVSPDKHGEKYVCVDGSVERVKVKGRTVPIFVGWDSAVHSNMIKGFTDYPV